MHPDSTRLLKLPPPHFSLPHHLRHQHGHSHPNKPAHSLTAPPTPETPLSRSLSLSLSLCSRYTTLAWDGMRKHRPKIPLDPETSSCSWIYHTNKERRGGEKDPPPPPKTKNTIQKHALLFQNAVLHPNWPLRLLFFLFLLLHFNSSSTIETETH